MELSRMGATVFSGRGASVEAEICVWASVEGGPRGVATGDPVQAESYFFLLLNIIFINIAIICITVGVPNCVVTYWLEFRRRKVSVTKMTVAIVKV